MRNLSPQELKVWEFILVYLEDHKTVPSNKQIAKHLKIDSEYTRQLIYHLVKSIEDKKSVVFTTERKMEFIESYQQSSK